MGEMKALYLLTLFFFFFSSSAFLTASSSSSSSYDDDDNDSTLRSFYSPAELSFLEISSDDNKNKVNSGYESSSQGDGEDGWPQQCRLGFVRRSIWAERSSRRREKCRSRGLRAAERPSLSGINHPNEISLGSFFDKHLLGKLRSDKTVFTVTQDIVFLGDSVSTQLAQFLICDIIRHSHRRGNPLLHHHAALKDDDFLVRRFNHTFSTFVVPFPQYGASKRGILRIHNQQFNLPCLHNNASGLCHYPEDVAVFNHVHRLLSQYTHEYDPLRHTAILFNYGLHVHRKFAWVFKPMLLALLRSAKSSPHVSILFRETSSQSFTGTPGGFFVHNMTSAPSSPCCSRPAQHPAQLEWRNALVRRLLGELDEEWSRHLRWLPFFNLSASLWDLRAEWNDQTALPDCTHFIYTPMSYIPLWESLQSSLQLQRP